MRGLKVRLGKGRDPRQTLLLWVLAGVLSIALHAAGTGSLLWSTGRSAAALAPARAKDAGPVAVVAGPPAARVRLVSGTAVAVSGSPPRARVGATVSSKPALVTPTEIRAETRAETRVVTQTVAAAEAKVEVEAEPSLAAAALPQALRACETFTQVGETVIPRDLWLSLRSYAMLPRRYDAEVFWSPEGGPEIRDFRPVGGTPLPFVDRQLRSTLLACLSGAAAQPRVNAGQGGTTGTVTLRVAFEDGGSPWPGP